MSDLEPCPFCSDKNIAIGSDGNGGQYIDCGRKHIVHFINCTKEEAINLWNTRPAEDAKDREIERLKKTIDLLETEHRKNSTLVTIWGRTISACYQIADNISHFRKLPCIYQRANNIKDICKDALNFSNGTNIPAKESEVEE